METTTKHLRSALFFALYLILGYSCLAGEIREGFDSPELDPNLWKITTAGKASFKLDKGRLILTSEGVEDGIFLYYVRKIGREDITIEVSLDPSEIKDAGAIGFTRELLTPTVNTDINPQFIATFMGVKPTGCYLMDETGQARLAMSANYDAEEHLFRTEVAGDRIVFSIDQEEMGELEWQVPERYYMITPDPYTSHYAGSISVDSIRIIGPNVQAVAPQSKLAITWGQVKHAR